jgi:CBS-domain-containing membrane protein
MSIGQAILSGIVLAVFIGFTVGQHVTWQLIALLAVVFSFMAYWVTREGKPPKG